MTATVTSDITETHEPTDQVAAARQTLNRLQEERLALTNDLEALERTLPDVQAASGEALLAQRRGTGDARPAISRAAELESEIVATRHALAVVADEYESAEEAVWEAQAQQARDQAAALRAEVDQIEAEVAPLLAQLRELNGSDYMLTWTYQRVVNQFALINQPLAPKPKTLMLQQQIEQLEQQAAGYDKRVMEHRRGRS